jgi:hypothetical protein
MKPFQCFFPMNIHGKAKLTSPAQPICILKPIKRTIPVGANTGPLPSLLNGFPLRRPVRVLMQVAGWDGEPVQTLRMWSDAHFDGLPVMLPDGEKFE